MTEIDWIVEHEPIETTPELVDFDDFSFIDLTIGIAATEEMSPLIQFILLPSVLDENTVTTIPVSSFDLYKECVENIAPLFSNVKGIKTKAALFPNEIQFSGVIKRKKEELLKRLTENSLHPVVSNLYGDLSAMRPKGLINLTRSYKLVTEKIDSYNETDFKNAWGFLANTYLKNYHVLSMVPTNWYLDSELKNSSALKFFNSVSDNVFIFVDYPTNRVIGIDVFA